MRARSCVRPHLSPRTCSEGPFRTVEATELIRLRFSFFLCVERQVFWRSEQLQTCLRPSPGLHSGCYGAYNNCKTDLTVSALTRTWFAKWVSVGLILCEPQSKALAQKIEWPHSPTLFVNCDTLKPPRTVVVASPVLGAKNSSYRAWVRVKSVLLPNGSSGCLNTTQLWISSDRNPPHRPAYIQLPVDPDGWGNGLQLVGWSPDGQLLLTELWQWNTMPNDAGVDRRILVFQPKTSSRFEIKLNNLWAGQKDRDCVVEFQLLGFNSQGSVALRAHIATFYDVDETETDKPAQKRCTEETRTWAIDPQTQKRQQLPDDFRAAQYSVVEKTGR
jgi:hypothetical protein